SGLRKALGHDRIVTQAPGYLVRIEPGELDVDRFERLLGGVDRDDSAGAAEAMRKALALWRGPPLGDLDDSFARAERARLEEQRRLGQAILQQDESLAAPARAAGKVPDALGGRRGRLRLFAIAAGALLLIAAAVTGIVLATRGSAAIVVEANSVAALDAKTG